MLTSKNNDRFTDRQDIVLFFQRQMRPFLLAAASVLLVGGAIIYSLPNFYEVKAEILIEQKAMFSRDEDIKSDQNIIPRVHAIVKTVMTSRNIESILRKYNLIDEDTVGAELHKAIAVFRKATRLEFSNVDVLNPNTGSEGKVSIGFSVEYENKSPDLAYEISTEITNLLLSLNDGKVATEEDQRLGFLKSELDLVLNDLKAQEKDLAIFKEKNQLYLPGLQAITLNRLEQVKSDLLENTDTLKILKSKKNTVQIELSKIKARQSLYTSDGKQVDGAAKRLAELESEYIEKSLAYTNSHPEMVRLTGEIQMLEQEVSQGSSKSRQSKSIVLDNNPEYIEVTARLVEVRADITQENIRSKAALKELSSIKEKIQKMPYVEQELLGLERNLEAANEKHKELFTQYSQVDLRRNMSRANLFDRFILVEPPEYPIKPSRPKKAIFAAVLSILAVALGLLVALMREWFNSKITGQHVLGGMGFGPVYTIPRFE